MAIDITCKCGEHFKVTAAEYRRAGHKPYKSQRSASVSACRRCYAQRFLVALDSTLESLEELRLDLRRQGTYPV